MILRKLLIFTIVLSLYSCKKMENPSATIPTEIPMNSFFPMSIGNFWVYEYITKSSDGSIIGNPSYDTLKIVKDTLINDAVFYVFKTNKPAQNTQFINRDSLGYIINQMGVITLPPYANEALYNFHYGYINGDTAYSYWEEFHDDITIINPTGNYNCLGRLSTHQAWPNWGGNASTDSTLYAEIGMVQRSYSYLSGAKVIGTLIDYHLEE